MKTKSCAVATPAFFRKSLLLLVLVLSLSASAFAQATGFTYQGRLTDGGTPANGNYDLQFQLFDSASGGTQIGPTQTLNVVAVSAGIFTVTLDFGANAFPGASRFLDISARPTGAGAFTPLTPRQPITATPYAVRSLNAGSADGLSSACNGCITNTNISGVAASKLTGTIPVSAVPSGSTNYIQNSSSQQASSNFNISGNGTAGGTLSAPIIAAGEYDIGLDRVLSGGFNNNLFAGVLAGGSVLGHNNSYVGTLAGGSPQNTGNNNSFFGYQAGSSNTTGGSNAFFGNMTGSSNTTGSSNAFFGWGAGNSNVDAGSNAFFGNISGTFNTTGYVNAFFGAEAGYHNTTGAENTFLGAKSGGSNTTGSSNTVIGSAADVASGNLSNATAIGSLAQVSQSNSLVLGSIYKAATNGTIPIPDTKVGIGITAAYGDAHRRYALNQSRREHRDLCSYEHRSQQESYPLRDHRQLVHPLRSHYGQSRLAGHRRQRRHRHVCAERETAGRGW